MANNAANAQFIASEGKMPRLLQQPLQSILGEPEIPVHFHKVEHALHQLFQGQRFLKKVCRTHPHGAHCVFQRGLAGHEHHGHIGLDVLHAKNHVKAIHAVHIDIGDDHVYRR